MSSFGASLSFADSRAPSRLLYWALVAAVALPMRFEIGVGPFATLSFLDLGLVACGVYFVYWTAALMPLKAGPPVIMAAVLIPAVLGVASILWSADPGRAATATIKYLHSALLYFVALQFGASLGIARLARTALVILAGWLAGSAAMYLGVPGFEFFTASSAGYSEVEMLEVLASVYTRLGHPYVGQSNDYAPLLSLLGFILAGSALYMRSRWLLVAGGIAFTASALTFSRGLMAGALVGLVAFAFMARPKLRQAAWFLAVPLLAAAAVAPLLVSDTSVSVAGRDIQVADVLESRLSEANLEARLEGYREVLSFVSQRPWLGYGAGYYDKSHPEGLVSAHNAFLEQWKYFGVLLGTLSIACYIMVMVHFFGLRHRTAAGPLADALACAWLCLLIASMAETFFEATTPRSVIYFLLGLCVAVFIGRQPAGRVAAARAPA
jgi:O-antigen ligase